MSGVAEFTVNFLLQGRSWYTKWITVLEQQPVFAAFDTLQYLDQVWDSSKRFFCKKKMLSQLLPLVVFTIDIVVMSLLSN